MLADKSELELIKQISLGDQVAFGHLYKRYRRALLHSITLIVKEPMAAEDALHDTYLKVWQKATSYDPQRGGVYNWLLNLARNTAIDTLRHRNRLDQLELTEANTAELFTQWPSVEDIGLRFYIDQRLTSRQRHLLELRYWQDQTLGDVAGQLTLPLGTVKTTLRQTLRMLRPLLAADYALSR